MKPKIFEWVQSSSVLLLGCAGVLTCKFKTISNEQFMSNPWLSAPKLLLSVIIPSAAQAEWNHFVTALRPLLPWLTLAGSVGLGSVFIYKIFICKFR